MTAIAHAEQVLLLDRCNAKALFRRGLACRRMGTEGWLRLAQADFMRVAELGPGNHEVRGQLQEVEEQLDGLRKRPGWSGALGLRREEKDEGKRGAARPRGHMLPWGGDRQPEAHWLV